LIASEAPFNPFPGLRPFEAEEDYLFFGREKQTDELLRRLRFNRFLSVVGTSGSGKSSLVRSGLIPALHGGFLAMAGSSWRVLIFRPGENPIERLASSLDAPDVLGTAGELASTNRVLLDATLRRGSLGLVDAVRQARIPPRDNVLVVVDQFEELFRFRRNRRLEDSRDESVMFVKLLLEATQQNEVPIYIVLTMRSDFIGDCMQYPGLPEAVNNGQYLVPRMTRDQLRSAITGPVAVGGGQIAPRLVLRLLNDLGDDQDQLPLLQHALMRTWEDCQRHRLGQEPIDLANYEAIGTIRSALSQHSEEAYAEASSGSDPKVTERMFKALTDTFSDQRGVRRPTSVQELAANCEVSESEVVRIIEIFRRPGRCFLMPPVSVPLDSTSMIDLSHESLMRCWIRLLKWADEEKVSASVYVRLSQAASWFDEGTAGLWLNPELEFGLRWKDQNRPTLAWASRYNSSFARAMEFLECSKQKQDRIAAEREKQRKNKLRWAWSVAVVFGIMLVIALVLANLARKEKDRAEENLGLAKKAVGVIVSSASGAQAREAADIAEMEEMRKELLGSAQGFYADLAKQEPARGEEFQKQAASTHARLGDIYRLLEKHTDAVEEYRRAINGYQSLAKDYPKKPEYRQELAYSYNWLGETLRIWLKESKGPLKFTSADVEDAYRGALDLQKELHAEKPEDADYQQQLARTYYNRGILRAQSGDMEAGESDFQEAIRLLEPLAVQKKTASLAQEDVSVPPSQDLARAYNNLACLLREGRKIPEARQFYERAIGISESLTNENPDNREYRVELATFYNNLAALLWDQNEVSSAKERNHQAIDLIEELATPAPALEGERAKAHELYGLLYHPQHPEFHVLYSHLCDLYADAARMNLKAGSLTDAQDALKRLSQMLPELAEPERSRFAKVRDGLKKELHEKEIKGK
jgi:tetratricopeptide (TPR) repeat protein/energy-coupling factor transporter ATP-binding protein EcfA2